MATFSTFKMQNVTKFNKLAHLFSLGKFIFISFDNHSHYRSFYK
ncbi:hypothetical protein CF65_00589 [Aggregatibacter actinomycetemcomitans HK1651]|nr:hypothetical protein CF65_00589 [Aggregatibacter actinomycetemcomitans HK1651]